MDHAIDRRLKGLLRRFRLFQLLCSLAIVWIAVAAMGYLLLRYGRQAEGISQAWLVGWLALIACGTIAAWLFARKWHRNVTSVARLIEKQFPSLEQRLTTAVELRPQFPDGGYSYLQRRVINEALIHDVQHEWDRLISARKLLAAGLASLPALLSLCVVGYALWKLPRTSFNALSSAGGVLSKEIMPPEVIPGNTEVQKGESLIVTARFPGQLPSQVWLVRNSLAEEGALGVHAERLLMKQSLSDPIFAAYINDIRQPVTYRIEYDQMSTPGYKIRVFECPEVVRSDAQLRYPLYSQLDAKEIADTRRVAAPIGTNLTWKIHLNKPFATGQLIPKEVGEPIPLTVSEENPLLATCSIEVKETSQWNVQLVDKEQRQNRIEVNLKVTAIANKPPVLQLTSGGDSVVSALQEFDVIAKVKDDYAVTAAGIGYQLAGGDVVEQELAVKVGENAKKIKESTVSSVIDFEALQAEPEQLLSYYMWIEDLDDSGQPRRITTDMYFAEVRPFDEIFRQADENAEAQQQQQQQQQNGNQQQGGQGEELLEMQKQIILASWNIHRSASVKGLPSRSKDDLSTVSQSQEQALEMLSELAAEAPDNLQPAVQSAEKAMNAAIEQLDRATQSLSKSDLAKAIGSEQQAYQALLKLQGRENQVARQQRSQQRGQQSRRQQSRQQQLNQLELDERENRYQDQRNAQEEQQNSSEQAETRQIASRLRELAMRQQDLNQQLRDVEAALQMAQNQEQRDELERRLERLRQQQQQILEDTDELQQRLQESQNASLQQTQQQLEQTRENLQQANQSLRESNTGQALASGSRAQEQLEQMREEVRQQAANQFGETMQQMRADAGQLQQRQQELIKDLQPERSTSESESPQASGLRESGEDRQVSAKETIQQQRQDLDELLDRMQETIEQAEESEPLLAQKLFDGYLRTRQEKVGEQLQVTEKLLERSLDSQARSVAGETLEDLKTLSSDIDQAAQSVLGSDINSMRLALDQLDVARRQIEGEIARETGQDSSSRDASDQNRDPSSSSESDRANDRSSNQAGQPSGEQQQAGRQQEPDGQERSSQQQSTRQQSGQQPTNQQQANQQNGQQQSGQQQSGQQQNGQQSTNQQSGQQQSGQQQSGSNQNQSGRNAAGRDQAGRDQAGRDQAGRDQQPGLRGGGNNSNQDREFDSADDAARPGLLGGNLSEDRNWRNSAPISGEDFRQWSDRLRDVEELISDPELRWEATRIRQAARNLRTDMQRGSKAPRWSDVEDLVASPLRQLQRKVSLELIRRAAEQNEIVPVDRDPVPNQYRDMVQEYYQRLGKGRK